MLEIITIALELIQALQHPFKEFWDLMAVVSKILLLIGENGFFAVYFVIVPAYILLITLKPYKLTKFLLMEKYQTIRFA